MGSASVQNIFSCKMGSLPFNLKSLKAFTSFLMLCFLLAACSTARQDIEQLPTNGNYTPGSVEEFSALVGDRIFFDTDQTSLTPQAQQTLDKQIAWLNKYSQYSFTIEGHADERGTREYNLALGARRSAAVKAYLISRGINTARFNTISYGKERPIAVCNDISCWSQNRRATTVLK